MKKIRFIFSLLALVLGIGGAIASSQLSLTVAYEFIADPEEPECRPHDEECQIASTMVPCQVNGTGPILRLNNTSTTCGQELWKVIDP